VCPDNVQVDHTEDIREDIDKGIDPLFERDLWGDAAYFSYAGAQQNDNCRNKVHLDSWANYSPLSVSCVAQQGNLPQDVLDIMKHRGILINNRL
jgi:hypothetical protein